MRLHAELTQKGAVERPQSWYTHFDSNKTGTICTAKDYNTTNKTPIATTKDTKTSYIQSDTNLILITATSTDILLSDAIHSCKFFSVECSEKWP